MKTKIVNTIPDGLKKLRDRFQAMAKREVEFGSMGPGGTATQQHSDSDLTVADVLQVHEYGIGVAERPLVRHVVAAKRRELGEALRDAAVAVLDDDDPDVAATEVGLVAQDLLLERLEELATTPLDEETLEDPDRPAGAPPLQVTGQIRESLQFHVREK